MKTTRIVLTKAEIELMISTLQASRKNGLGDIRLANIDNLLSLLQSYLDEI